MRMIPTLRGEKESSSVELTLSLIRTFLFSLLWSREERKIHGAKPKKILPWLSRLLLSSSSSSSFFPLLVMFPLSFSRGITVLIHFLTNSTTPIGSIRKSLERNSLFFFFLFLWKKIEKRSLNIIIIRGMEFNFDSNFFLLMKRVGSS